MDITLNTDYAISVPQNEVSLMKKVMAKFGWDVKRINKKTAKTEIEKSLLDAKEGRVTSYSSLEEYFNKVGI